MATATKLPTKALIGGAWVDGAGGTFDVVSPHTGEIVNTVTRCDTTDVDHAVAAARAAQPAWAATSLMERVEILRRINRLFVERGEEIAQMITAEIGKTITETREEVYEYAAPAWHRAGEEVLRHRGMSFPSTQERTQNKKIVLTHRPLGVVAAIAPYNFPTDISSIAVSSIVAAGNTCVWKPSEYTPTCCAMVAELFEEAGLPSGVINVIQGLGDVGAALVQHDDVNGIFFTGSTKTGKWITANAGLKRQLLELGGDGPQIVLPDADIDRSVEGALVGCYYLAGQVCTSAERILVHELVHDEFVEKLKKRIGDLKVGDPTSEDTDMGPLANRASLERVATHVEDARSKGAEVFQAGEIDGLYYPPTILTGVTQDMLVAKEETFGPVASVFSVKSADEAVEIANSTEFGLIASLWTRDLATAWRIGEALHHGSVNINETSNYWDQLAPFGGAKNSGVGRELSGWFLNTFTEEKLLVFDIAETSDRTDRRSEGGW